MNLFDIHTHRYGSGIETTILNSTSYISGRYISVGLHPWDIDGEWKGRLHEIAKAADAENVAAIGECGFDKIKSPADIATQTDIFILQAELAEKVAKPLLIHCVKGFDELIAACRSIKPKQPWIIHGFRGNSHQAAQLIKCGFYLSLGERFNADTARSIPDERLFIESDESEKEIAVIYREIATARGCSIEELDDIVTSNIGKVFNLVSTR